MCLEMKLEVPYFWVSGQCVRSTIRRRRVPSHVFPVGHEGRGKELQKHPQLNCLHIGINKKWRCCMILLLLCQYFTNCSLLLMLNALPTKPFGEPPESASRLHWPMAHFIGLHGLQNASWYWLGTASGFLPICSGKFRLLPGGIPGPTEVYRVGFKASSSP